MFFFTSFNSNFFYFENIYGIHISKLLCLSFHILASLITSLILYLIIVYEKNCNYRTLINQMVSSLMCNALTYNLIMTPLTLLFTLISPIDSPVICRIYFFTNNVISFHMLFLIDAMLIIKYIFISHLKNPTAVQDDFWTFWINLWTFAFFLLSTTVVNTLPGRDPPRVTICIGKIPLTSMLPTNFRHI
jgi:hypothetical protein